MSFPAARPVFRQGDRIKLIQPSKAYDSVIMTSIGLVTITYPLRGTIGDSTLASIMWGTSIYKVVIPAEEFGRAGGLDRVQITLLNIDVMRVTAHESCITIDYQAYKLGKLGFRCHRGMGRLLAAMTYVYLKVRHLGYRINPGRPWKILRIPRILGGLTIQVKKLMHNIDKGGV